MRVLITIHRISLGGADRVAILLANGFVAAGFRTRLAILRDGGEGEPSLLKLLDPAVEVVRAGPAMGSRHLELLRGYRFLRREIAAWRPDVVLASSNNMGLVTGLAAGRRWARRPRTTMKFTNPVVRPRDWGALRIWYRRWLYRFVLGRYDLILTLSPAEAMTLRRLYPRYAARIRTVANPYVSDLMLAASRPPRPPDRVRIVACGRMMPQKRFDRLVAAVSLLGLPQMELIILGDGPLRPVLERQVRALGLDRHVHLPGFVEDVEAWLRTADLLALSSDYEGFPAVVLEALACGVPVVTTDCFDGARALLDGVPPCAVVPRTDLTGLARAMAAALAAEPDAAALRRVALPYRMQAAMRDHVAAITDLTSAVSERPAAQ